MGVWRAVGGWWWCARANGDSGLPLLHTTLRGPTSNSGSCSEAQEEVREGNTHLPHRIHAPETSPLGASLPHVRTMVETVEG